MAEDGALLCAARLRPLDPERQTTEKAGLKFPFSAADKQPNGARDAGSAVRLALRRPSSFAARQKVAGVGRCGFVA